MPSHSKKSVFVSRRKLKDSIGASGSKETCLKERTGEKKKELIFLLQKKNGF